MPASAWSAWPRTRDRDEQLAMIDLNVRALTELSLAFVDSLARHKGGLLNVGSIAGFLPGPGMAVYYATKAYVLSFSEALHSELERARHPRHACCARARCRPNSPNAPASTSGLAPGLLTQSAEHGGGGGLSRPDGAAAHGGAAGPRQQAGARWRCASRRAACCCRRWHARQTRRRSAQGRHSGVRRRSICKSRQSG